MLDKKTNESANYDFTSSDGAPLGNTNYNLNSDATCSITVTMLPAFYSDPDATTDMHALVDQIIAQAKTYLPTTTPSN